MERFNHLATIAAALVAAFAFLFGIYQFNETQRMAQKNLQLQTDLLDNEREIKAVELFLKFNEQQEAFASKPPQNRDAAFWQQNASLSITETIFKLVGKSDEGWKATVAWMLETQKPFITNQPFKCDTFSQEFIQFAKLTAGMRCE